jgi:hypothetical protein
MFNGQASFQYNAEPKLFPEPNRRAAAAWQRDPNWHPFIFK